MTANLPGLCLTGGSLRIWGVDASLRIGSHALPNGVDAVPARSSALPWRRRCHQLPFCVGQAETVLAPMPSQLCRDLITLALPGPAKWVGPAPIHAPAE